MYCLSQVMKTISAGYTYATFAGLCIIATIFVGIVKFNQMPDMFTIIGMFLIISGVLIVNLVGTMDKNMKLLATKVLELEKKIDIMLTNNQ